MKKHLLFVLAACALLVSCQTTEKTAIAYHQANQADHERILALKASGQPDIWPEVFERYCSLRGRNEEMSRMPERVKKSVNYTKLNLEEELNSARNKAEAYLEAKIAQDLQKEGADIDRTNQYIWQLWRVNPKNSRLGEFKLAMLMKQADDILIGCTPRRGTHLPMGVEQALVSFDANELAAIPAKVHYHKQRSVKYGVIADIVINHCDAGSDRDEAVSFKESNGNLTATVTDHTLSKTATIKGMLNLYEPKKGDLLVSIPLEANSKFSYNYSTIDGSREACSEQTLERLSQQPLPFPTDASIITDAAKEFNNLVAKTLSGK